MGVGWVGRGFEWIMGLFACRGVGLGMANGRGGQSAEDALLEGLGFGVCCVGLGFGMGGDGLGFGVCCGMGWGMLDFELVWIQLDFEVGGVG